MEVPITQIINVATVFVLIFIVSRVLRRSFQQKALPLFLFALAFLSILFMMGMFALPFTVVRHAATLQVIFSIADFAFMVAVALFAAVTISLILPTNRILLVILPSIIGIIGLSLFLWQISNSILPTFPLRFFTWGNVAFIHYRDNSPVALKIMQGVIAVCTFLIGAFLFFRQTHSMEGAVRKRSFLLGSGYVMAVVATVANYIVGAFPEFQGFAFLMASLAVLVGVLFIYWGMCVRVAGILDKEEENVYQ